MENTIIRTRHTGKLLKWPNPGRWCLLDYGSSGLRVGDLVLFLGYSVEEHPGFTNDWCISLRVLGKEKIAMLMLYPKNSHNRNLPSTLQSLDEIETATYNIFGIGETMVRGNT